MSQRNVLILERSSQNLKKIEDKGKVVLEGVFAEFGIENRNGRIYEEREYLPHLEYLKKDMTNGNLLGELDHPERFEVALGNVSHRISELWYDQSARQVKGRIEILDTPKGIIAKSLLEAGVPLSISSRAAGTVNEDKTVQIQQIYTYDLVAKPGFESAQLKSVTESAKARISNQISKLNESEHTRQDHNISTELGIINENVSILDLTEKYPSVKLREEALALQKELSNSNVKNKNVKNQMEEVNENVLQQWTVFFKNELSKINEKISKLEESAISNGSGSKSGEIKLIKNYVEKLRKVQEGSLAWQEDIAKAVNKVARYADSLAEKSNEHYKLTNKIVETVDENAKVLNHTQDWVGNNAKVTNAIAETVDHNAEMLNKINEWNEEIAKGVNDLHEWGTEKAQAINAMYEWGTEKAKAINGIHEWTSSIAKNLNTTAEWSEDMFGRAMSKSDAKKLIEYVELVSESKKNPELKRKLMETLKTKRIKSRPVNENMITGIKGVPGLGTITDPKTTGNSKVNTDAGKDSGVIVDDKYHTIISKIRGGKFSKSSKPKGVKVLDKEDPSNNPVKGGTKVKGVMTLDTVKSKSKPTIKITSTSPKTKNQNLKLDTKPSGHLKEEREIRIDRSSDLKKRSSALDEKLSKIINSIEKEKKVDESLRSDFPFLSLLGESDRKDFAALSLTDKKRVHEEVKKNPTTDAGVIKALWENAIAKRNAESNEPLWLKAAPKEYREIFDKSPVALKESVKARAEFYDLKTQYQINNFWQTSGLNPKKEGTTLNEVFTAKTPKEGDQKLDSFVSQVGEMMKKYQK